MARRRFLSLGIGVTAALGLAFGIREYGLPLHYIVTGKAITPLGSHVDVGSFPDHMILTPDGQFVIVTNTGFRQQLSVLDAATGKLVDKDLYNTSTKKNLYYGLDAITAPNGETLVAASCGASDQIAIYHLSKDGHLGKADFLSVPKVGGKTKLTAHVSGVAFTPDGTKVWAALNQSYHETGYRGSLAVVPLDGTAPTTTEVGAFPMGVVHLADGSTWVANEGGDAVTRLGPDGKKKHVRTGAGPVAVIANKAGTRLFVSNSNSDTVSVIDTKRGRVVRTLTMRPVSLKAPGVTPLGMALSPNEETLYVALGDLHSVAVIDVNKGDVRGYLPAGWYPTSVVVTPDAKRLFVSNAKGQQTANPNKFDVGKLGRYHPNILEGTVAMVDLPNAIDDLAKNTEIVLRNNRTALSGEGKITLKNGNPGIEHVVYVIKENRTYDQILGDIERGNGDPSLVMFGRDVTPNQHALAERFVLLDNFYVCAEVSADGWNWSTSAMANAYTERNVFTNYGGHGRAYDFEGTANGDPLELLHKRDPATPPNGYIWDQCRRQNVSFRNYGIFTSFGGDRTKDDVPTKKALIGKSCLDFRRYDLSYADSEAWVKHGLEPAPKQTKSYGSHKEPSRMTVWLREYRKMVKYGTVPRFMMLRLGRDHTSGTAAGQYSPRAMVADNDYAVGQLVEAISNGPYWKKTAIVVLEDDAQAGFDHVDCHRSTVYVISPYIRRNSIDSSFYNTASALRTIELLLGLKPLNSYDSIANPFQVFWPLASNSEPYHAILPAKEIVGEINQPTAYRAKDSARLISLYNEESLPDIELNDILWGAAKGAKTPRPTRTNAKWVTALRDDD